jgi:ubiquinone/menaquinone biosynthesis C-methylase UbiE
MPDRVAIRASVLHEDFLRQQQHPSWLDRDKEFWIAAAKEYLLKNPNQVIADIGSTGFIPLTIGPLFGKYTTIICSDVSPHHLSGIVRKVEKKELRCKVITRTIEKLDMLRLPYADKSVDVVTMNSSFAHGLPVSELREEIRRILQPGGIIIIGHERNKYHREHTVVKTANTVFGKKPKVHKDLLRTHVNDALMAEGLITAPLSQKELHELISEKPGVYYDKLFADYKVLFAQTYDHLVSKHKQKGAVRLAVSKYLEKKYPKHGSEFFLVLQKPTG